MAEQVSSAISRWPIFKKTKTIQAKQWIPGHPPPFPVELRKNDGSFAYADGVVQSREGEFPVKPGMWIVFDGFDDDGETSYFYGIQDEVFRDTYEVVRGEG